MTGSAQAADPTYSINCGGGASGSFSADGYASGGTKYTTTALYIETISVQDPAPQAVYLSERYGMNFSYTFPGFTPGTYHPVRLHFAEYKYDAAGKRTFSVSINGQTALSGYDVFAAAGAKYKAVTQTFVTAADSSGKIKIVFTGGSDNAEIKGIEVFGALILTSPDPTGHPDQGDGKNQYTYDTTSPQGVIYIPGVASSAGAPQSVMQYLISSQNFDIGITPALPSQLDHTLSASGNIISVQTTGSDTAGNSIQANDFVANQLPLNNTDFGNHNVLTTGGAGSQSATIQTFYTATASNYPGAYVATPSGQSVSGIPNWYQYYDQVYTAKGAYDSGAGSSYTDYVSPYAIHLRNDVVGQWNFRVFTYHSGDAFVKYAGILYVNGINHYVYTNAHERGHQAIFQHDDQEADKHNAIYNWQYPTTQIPYSHDGDQVSDVWEQNHHMDNLSLDTTGAYGSQSNGDIGDNELVADVQALSDTIASISEWNQDWANNGVNFGARGSSDPVPPDFFLTFNPVTGRSADGTYTFGPAVQVRGLSDLPADTLTSLP